MNRCFSSASTLPQFVSQCSHECSGHGLYAVIATGFASNLPLRDALEEPVPEVVAIGDCAKPRNIEDAIWEGFHAARVLQ